MERPHLASLTEFPAATLRVLAAALRTGALKYGVSVPALLPITGSARAPATAALLQSLLMEGCPHGVVADLCEGMAVARAKIDAAEALTGVALSGPEVTGTPVVDTATMVAALFEEARERVVVASYVFVKARECLAPLAAKHDAMPGFLVRFIVDISHQRQGPDEPLTVAAARFRRRFLEEHWAGKRPPEIWHDARRFRAAGPAHTGVMHAKAVLVDASAALITSANFTEAAQSLNIEAGVIIRNAHLVNRLVRYFDGLVTEGHLTQI
jgi:phosphatidylserine/phosphatidylglycerophosphate/cardiolipin synthase-like enzyme